MFERIFGTMYRVQSHKGDNGETIDQAKVFLAQAPIQFKDHVGKEILVAKLGTEKLQLDTQTAVRKFADLLETVPSVTLTLGNRNCSTASEAPPQEITLTRNVFRLMMRFGFRTAKCLCHSSFHGEVPDGFNMPGLEYGECKACGESVYYSTDPRPSTLKLKSAFPR